jgi:urease accessory protein
METADCSNRPDRRGVLAVVLGACAAVALSSSPALAHTGGELGGLWDGLSHPLLGLDHVVAMVTVGVLAVTMWRPLAAPGAFIGAMVVGGAFGLAGAALPAGETAIALSVVLLGAALLAGRSAHPSWTLPLIGLAGLTHGNAHGLEAPAAAHPVVYVAGFVGATVALHLTGVGMGLLVRSRTPARAVMGAAVLGAGAGLVAGLI